MCLLLGLTIWAYPDQGTTLVAKICPKKGIGQGVGADSKDVQALQGDTEEMKHTKWTMITYLTTLTSLMVYSKSMKTSMPSEAAQTRLLPPTPA